MAYILCTWLYWFRFLPTARSRRGVGSQTDQPASYYKSLSAESDPDFNLVSAGSDEIQYHIESSSNRDLPGRAHTQGGGCGGLAGGGRVSSPIPRGEVERSGRGGLQAYTRGGRLRGLAGGVSRPIPRGGDWEVWLGGVSRPKPRGVYRPRPAGGGVVYPSMHWGRYPPSRRLLLRTVRILLECILAVKCHRDITKRRKFRQRKNWTDGEQWTVEYRCKMQMSLPCTTASLTLYRHASR